MQIIKNINLLTKKEFLSIFGNIFEKSEWIADKVFQLKPFKNSEDFMIKIIKIYENSSKEEIINIFKLHPKLVVEKNLTSFSSKEQAEANLDNCNDKELLEFENLNKDYEIKFGFPFIIAVKGKNKSQILENFRTRIKNSLEDEFAEAKKQVKNIASFRLNKILKNN
tara:strand:- start:400 stop:900 length:501 start_codon:yes stop_codon:yes gene_type:complete